MKAIAKALLCYAILLVAVAGAVIYMALAPRGSWRRDSR